MSDKKKVKFNLVGCDGNAFAVIGGWVRAAKKQGFDKDYIDSVVDSAQSGNYENLLCVFIEHSEGQ